MLEMPGPSSSTRTSTHEPFSRQPIPTAAAGHQGRVDRVADQVDQELLDLVGVRAHGQRRTVLDEHGQPGLQGRRRGGSGRDELERRRGAAAGSLARRA